MAAPGFGVMVAVHASDMADQVTAADVDGLEVDLILGGAAGEITITGNRAELADLHNQIGRALNGLPPAGGGQR